MRRLLVVGVLLLGSCRELRDRMTPERDAGPQAERVDHVFEPPPPGPVGLRPGRYRLLEVGATVTARTARGTAWDLFGGAGPDPRLAVQVDGVRVAGCDGAANALEVVCTTSVALSIDEQTVIEVTATDDDLGADDRIGEASGTSLLARGRAGVRMLLEPRGQVTSAYVLLVKVADPPGPLARHRWRLIGLGVGLASGLLVLALFRGGVLRHALAPGADWRCRFCEARSPASARTCHHCGGRR